MALSGSSVPTVVIYRLGSLGDTIVALPCFHAIRRAFPHHRRLALTNIPVSTKAAPLESILGGGDFVDGAISYPLATRKVGEILRVARDLRTVGADTLIYIGGGRGLLSVYRDLAFFRLCGFKRIIGAPATVDDNRGRVDHNGIQEPEAQRLARCLASLGPINLDDPSQWDLRLTEAEQRQARELLNALDPDPMIAINMGGKAAQKDWGEENWRQFLAKLSSAVPGLGLVIVGALEDRGRAQRLAQTWKGKTLEACGRLTPRESAALMQKADLFVGHDSGPLHLATAAGVRCVGLFGDSNRPQKWHPNGAGHTVVHEMRGMNFINVDQVCSLTLAALGRTAI